MVKGMQRTLERGPKQTARIVTERIRIRGVTVAIDGTAVGFGSFVISGFPEGNILFLGAAAYMTVSEAAAEIANDFAGDFAIGTTPMSDGTLADGDVDLVPATAIVATASTTPRTRGVSATATGCTVHDNTAGTLEMNGNILIDDADISDDADVLVDLDLDIAYIILGDD